MPQSTPQKYRGSQETTMKIICQQIGLSTRNGQISRNIERTKTESWINRKSEQTNYQQGDWNNNQTWASLVAQRSRICPPMQGTQARALVWEDPTCRGATKPMSHNHWACAPGAWAPQQEKPRQWKAHAPRWRVAPACHNWRKPSHRNGDPTQPKLKR